VGSHRDWNFKNTINAATQTTLFRALMDYNPTTSRRIEGEAQERGRHPHPNAEERIAKLEELRKELDWDDTGLRQ
jgi:hypothetical protein